MDALSHYFSMGGYGRFIWPAYGVTLLVLVLLVLDTIGRARRRRAELARLERTTRVGGRGAAIDDA